MENIKILGELTEFIGLENKKFLRYLFEKNGKKQILAIEGKLEQNKIGNAYYFLEYKGEEFGELKTIDEKILLEFIYILI